MQIFKKPITGRYKPVYTTPTKGAGLIFEAFEIEVPVSSDKGCYTLRETI